MDIATGIHETGGNKRQSYGSHEQLRSGFPINRTKLIRQNLIP